MKCALRGQHWTSSLVSHWSGGYIKKDVVFFFLKKKIYVSVEIRKKYAIYLIITLSVDSFKNLKTNVEIKK